MVLCVIVGLFIMLDVLTGFVKAVYNKKINSTLLRQGLFHKLSEVLAVVLAFLLEYTADYLSIGSNIPVATVVVSYISIMEIISSIENLCEVNPKLAKLFKPYLDKLKSNKWGDKMGILVLSNTEYARRRLASQAPDIFNVYNQSFQVVTTDYIIDGDSIIVSLEPHTAPTESEVRISE